MMKLSLYTWLALSAAAAAAPVTCLPGQSSLPATTRAVIDSAARTVLAETGAPSASVAVVRDGAIAYTNAYGLARLDPKTSATASMRYSIGSISKQFTATAVLLLAERHKLSLDDKVGRWLPELTRANEVSLRQILSMTSGYQDYWPQDYVMPPMLEATTAQRIVDEWARKPLDFDPGTKWQYSNTNYVIAGLIVEKASGMPLVDFLRKEVFTPLHMTSVFISDEGALPPTDAQRYLRYALGPPRPAPKEGRGWLFAAGELAMTAGDLARWDMSVIDQKILTPASYHAQQTTVLLANGTATGYGLGVDVATMDGHRLISHNGEVSGFTAENDVYPDDRTAVVVLTNLDATGAPGQIARRIADALFATSDAATARATAQARAIFLGLQHGSVERSLFTTNANAYFSARALADFASSLGPLGAPTEFVQTRQSLRGGMTFRAFRVRAGGRTMTVTTFTTADGKLEQYQVEAG
ncbi:MAG TPA: serine hydrolase domain-containing protein [Gemmatimonadaceae bacterium]|nr:serine hydrolase domain-containing protein [Gemmatimonadaceae bacterium]